MFRWFCYPSIAAAAWTVEYIYGDSDCQGALDSISSTPATLEDPCLANSSCVDWTMVACEDEPVAVPGDAETLFFFASDDCSGEPHQALSSSASSTDCTPAACVPDVQTNGSRTVVCSLGYQYVYSYSVPEDTVCREETAVASIRDPAGDCVASGCTYDPDSTEDGSYRYACGHGARNTSDAVWYVENYDAAGCEGTAESAVSHRFPYDGCEQEACSASFSSQTCLPSPVFQLVAAYTDSGCTSESVSYLASTWETADEPCEPNTCVYSASQDLYLTTTCGWAETQEVAEPVLTEVRFENSDCSGRLSGVVSYSASALGGGTCLPLSCDVGILQLCSGLTSFKHLAQYTDAECSVEFSVTSELVPTLECQEEGCASLGNGRYSLRTCGHASVAEVQFPVQTGVGYEQANCTGPITELVSYTEAAVSTDPCYPDPCQTGGLYLCSRLYTFARLTAYADEQCSQAVSIRSDLGLSTACQATSCTGPDEDGFYTALTCGHETAGSLDFPALTYMEFSEEDCTGDLVVMESLSTAGLLGEPCHAYNCSDSGWVDCPAEPTYAHQYVYADTSCAEPVVLVSTLVNTAECVETGCGYSGDQDAHTILTCGHAEPLDLTGALGTVTDYQFSDCTGLATTVQSMTAAGFGGDPCYDSVCQDGQTVVCAGQPEVLYTHLTRYSDATCSVVWSVGSERSTEASCPASPCADDGEGDFYGTTCGNALPGAADDPVATRVDYEHANCTGAIVSKLSLTAEFMDGDPCHPVACDAGMVVTCEGYDDDDSDTSGGGSSRGPVSVRWLWGGFGPLLAWVVLAMTT